nr:heavy metal translocating P-type ATPase [uncultured Blautia sp.]
MKATILHESRGRMRLKLSQKKLTLRQADLLETWLRERPWAKEAVVHERTGCIILYYKGNRNDILSDFAHFSWNEAEEHILLPETSTRELNRSFEEKLVKQVLTKIGCTLFLPSPLRIARSVLNMIPFLWRGARCIFRRRIRVDLLDAISIGISACRKDFGTADSVMFLLKIGELLEEWTRKKSMADLAQCMALNVDRVWLRTPEGDILTPISQICLGDQVVVRAGGIIPIDGIVLEGEAAVNQASLTGESLPIMKRSGGVVYAGTIVEEGEFTLEVKCVSGQSRYDQIVTMIEQSEQMKSASESKASRLADKLVPYTFAGSLLSFALTRNVTRSLSVLMVDFSCALKLAIPLSVLSAMREAGRKHITVKGGKFLEAIAQADTIVFDKTGTLTHACPKVVQVIPFGGKNETEMLRLAACLEEHFPHSMANAVVKEAEKRNLSHEEFHSKVEYLVAHGIASSVNGEKVMIGSAHFIFEDEQCTVPEKDQNLFDSLPSEYSHLYLAIGNQLAAVICISDPLRDETASVLAALKELGIRQTVMLTGDNKRTAQAIALQAGVDSFKAEVLPEDKAAFIAELRKEHIVIMVGDGINDAPALSEADVGIAISDGAAIAREISDITIAAESLWELAELRKLSLELMKRIRTNYRFIISFNGSLIALGAGGILSPSASATLHNLSTLAISLHSMSDLPMSKN